MTIYESEIFARCARLAWKWGASFTCRTFGLTRVYFVGPDGRIEARP